MNRRSFLKGLAGVSAGLIFPIAAPTPHLRAEPAAPEALSFWRLGVIEGPFHGRFSNRSSKVINLHSGHPTLHLGDLISQGHEVMMITWVGADQLTVVRGFGGTWQ